MPSTRLRELKKARTRRLIADTAARLFAERGYEHVAVSDVAREAEGAEQTVYNYFPAKEQLADQRVLVTARREDRGRIAPCESAVARDPGCSGRQLVDRA